MIGASLAAATIYLVPLLAWLCVRSRRDRGLWEIAADVPLWVALDLLLVLLLARVMRLETAALVSRPLWLAGAAAWWAVRARRADAPAWPAALERRALLQAAVLAALALALSLAVSRPCAVWDREWHIQLVTSLRGQVLPLMNVYTPRSGLYYHFTGNVLAVMLQAFSRDALHASLALSLVHDLMFVLTGAFLGVMLFAAGVRRVVAAAAILGAALLAGPVTILREPLRKLEAGHSLVNYLSLGFRPHASLGYLLSLGFLAAVAGAVLGRERARALPARLRLALFGCAAGLALTDEATLLLLGLGLGLVWMLDPGALASDRKRGAALMAALVAVLVAVILLFVGAVGPGAPHNTWRWVAPRMPGFLNAAQPLSGRDGLALFVQDLLPILGTALGLGLLAIGAARRRERVLAVFHGAVTLVALVALTAVEINDTPIEGHRWVTASFVLGPVLAALALARRGPGALAGLPAMMIFLSCGLGVASTIEWLGSGLGQKECRRHQNFDGLAAGERFYDVDCRRMAGARLGEATETTYVEARGFYLYTGCHPTFVSGPPPWASSQKKMPVGRPQFGRAALVDLHQKLLPPGALLQVVCERGGLADDMVCARARAKGGCVQVGEVFEKCGLEAGERAELLGDSGRLPK